MPCVPARRRVLPLPCRPDVHAFADIQGGGHDAADAAGRRCGAVCDWPRHHCEHRAAAAVKVIALPSKAACFL
eukprot:349855-Chlamydomonas_euryale.AAC.10